MRLLVIETKTERKQSGNINLRVRKERDTKIHGNAFVY